MENEIKVILEQLLKGQREITQRLDNIETKQDKLETKMDSLEATLLHVISEQQKDRLEKDKDEIKGITAKNLYDIEVLKSKN